MNWWVVLAPVVPHYCALRAVARFTAGAERLQLWGSAQVLEDAICLTKVHHRTGRDGTFSTRHEPIRILLAQVRRIDARLVEGDAGFADANAEHHLFVIRETNDAAHAFVLTNHGALRDAENFMRALTDAGLLTRHPPIQGLLRGVAIPLAHLWTALLVVIIAALAWSLVGGRG